MMRFSVLPRVVYASDRTEAGVPTGSWRKCRLDGCRGVRLSVRRPDGRHTFPCTLGMLFSPDGTEAEIYSPLQKENP